jgi:putative hydrolase of the HAD superfamily
MSKIKGILFDSGRVLNIPTTGNWYHSPNFIQILGKDKFYNVSKEKRKIAFTSARNYIDSIKVISTIEEEWEHFSMFFTIIAEELPELEIHGDKKKLLVDDFVFNFDKYTFFKDVFEVIPKLSKCYKLGLVSDAWPSLRGVYKKAGLDTYFNSIIISSELGVTKPNEQMYKASLNELALSENEVVFIDDNPKNCDGASKIGIRTIILDRSLMSRFNSRFILKTQHKIVKNLYEFQKLIQKINI